MEFTGLGGGIMLAVAAGLWLVYLVPTWVKRREFMATERNAVRLQQTIRVLAETTEAPTQALRRAPRGPVAVGRPVAPAQSAAAQRQGAPLLAAQRLRRTRAAAAVVLLGSVGVGIAQVVAMITTGVAAGAWLIIGGSLLAAVFSLALLGKLADVSRSRRAPSAATARRSQRLVDHNGAVVAEDTAQAEWTPVAVPKPMYLSRGVAPAAAESSADLAESLRRAALEAAENIRAADDVPSIQPAAQEPQRPAATGFAAMGIVDATATTTPDIDAVLARRRAAG